MNYHEISSNKIIKEPVEILSELGEFSEVIRKIQMDVNKIIKPRNIFDTDLVDDYSQFYSFFLLELNSKTNINNVEWFSLAIERLSTILVKNKIPKVILETVIEIQKIHPEYTLKNRMARLRLRTEINEKYIF
jgi:hypothetical protein